MFTGRRESAPSTFTAREREIGKRGKKRGGEVQNSPVPYVRSIISIARENRCSRYFWDIPVVYARLSLSYWISRIDIAIGFLFRCGSFIYT